MRRLPTAKASLCFNPLHSVRQYHRTNVLLSKDVIVGVYNDGELTSTGKSLFNSEFISSSYLKGTKWEAGKIRLLHHVNNVLSNTSDNNNTSVARIAFVGLGEKNKTSTNDQILLHQFSDGNDHQSALLSNVVRENVTAAIKALTKDDKDATQTILIDDFENRSQEVAEAAQMATWKFDEFKDLKDPSKKKDVNYSFSLIDPSRDNNHFETGTVFAESQNFARILGEMPGNKMTPTIFCEAVKRKLEECNSDKLTVEIRDREWAQGKQMESFLAVAKGSAEEPKVLEITYRGNPDSDQIDLCLVGKGITFDSGGISLKPGAGMKDMRGDCGGAATTVAAMYGIAKLNLSLNVKVICMLCENMPGPASLKPGDVIQAMNKVTIEVDNTDAEGRLILADGLCYASEMKPNVLVDVATLTGACVVALGTATTGVYTSSLELWRDIEKSGCQTNDLMWRMPLFIDIFKKQLKSTLADLNNIGGKEAGSCTAATFLSQFVDLTNVKHWAHLDIAGTFMGKDGMTGRPSRALLQLAKNMSNK